MKIIGHRGALALAEENTLLSFKAALHEKVDVIEIDIRSTSDGILVLHHDPNIHSLTIKKVPYHNLKAAQANLLTLEEALQFLRRRCPLIIEIKKDTDVSVLIKEFRRLKLPSKGIIFSSFHMPILLALKKTFPNITLAVNERWSGIRASYRARKLGTRYIAMSQRWLWSGFIRGMSKRGYCLSAYPVNDPIKAHRWGKYGLYGIFTDSPDRFH